MSASPRAAVPRSDLSASRLVIFFTFFRYPSPLSAGLVSQPGRDIFCRFCPHLDWPQATEARAEGVPSPGREFFRRICPHLDFVLTRFTDNVTPITFPAIGVIRRV